MAEVEEWKNNKQRARTKSYNTYIILCADGVQRGGGDGGTPQREFPPAEGGHSPPEAILYPVADASRVFVSSETGPARLFAIFNRLCGTENNDNNCTYGAGRDGE